MVSSIITKFVGATVGTILSLALSEASPLLSTPTAATATILFDGTGTPEAAGWSSFSSIDAPGSGTITIIPQFSGNPSDVLSVSTTGTAIQLYSRNIGATNYIISIGARVIRSSFNSFDYGFGLSPFAQEFPQGFVEVDRINSLTIGENSIQWTDSEGGGVALDTLIFHEYAISHINGNLNVYIDESFDDIIAGIATPVLTRTGVTPQTESAVGTVAFGDQSNDSIFSSNCCVNSAYELDFVRFKSLDGATPIPEPNTMTGVALSLLGLVFLQKNKASFKG